MDMSDKEKDTMYDFACYTLGVTQGLFGSIGIDLKVKMDRMKEGETFKTAMPKTEIIKPDWFKPMSRYKITGLKNRLITHTFSASNDRHARGIADTDDECQEFIKKLFGIDNIGKSKYDSCGVILNEDNKIVGMFFPH